MNFAWNGADRYAIRASIAELASFCPLLLWHSSPASFW
jgi:hypothetical protein